MPFLPISFLLTRRQTLPWLVFHVVTVPRAIDSHCPSAWSPEMSSVPYRSCLHVQANTYATLDNVCSPPALPEKFALNSCTNQPHVLYSWPPTLVKRGL